MGDLLLENDDDRLLMACRGRIGVSGGDSIVMQLSEDVRVTLNEYIRFLSDGT